MLSWIQDISRSYPAHSTFLTSPEQLEGVSPAVTFTIRAEKSGTHLLFLRWTGGDNFGGGDSLYVALKDKKTNKYVSGAETIKPAVEAIDGPLSNFGGCCYVRYLPLILLLIIYFNFSHSYINSFSISSIKLLFL